MIIDLSIAGVGGVLLRRGLGAHAQARPRLARLQDRLVRAGAPQSAKCNDNAIVVCILYWPWYRGTTIASGAWLTPWVLTGEVHGPLRSRPVASPWSRSCRWCHCISLVRTPGTLRSEAPIRVD